MYSVHLGDKDGGHSLVERGAVHVDGGADGQHEAGDPLVDAVILLQAAKRHRQRGSAEMGEAYIINNQNLVISPRPYYNPPL